jgi:two-component system, sporulation sensor kinase B
MRMSIEVTAYRMLLNLLFLIVVILVWLLVADRDGKYSVTKRKRQFAIFLTASIATIFCITISVPIKEGIQFDLRSIPMIIGGLYGGPAVSLGIFLISNAYRAFFEDVGSIIFLLSSGLFLTSTALFSTKFLLLNSKKRIIVGTIFVSLAPVLYFILITFVWKQSISTITILIGVFIKIVGTILVILLIEMVQKNFLLRKNVIQSKKLELVSNLAASVSHEIRNPLTTTKGFLQLLMETEVDEKRLQYFDLSLSELKRAESIISDYLTFAKPAPEVMEQLNIKGELERIVDLIRPMANMNSIDIITEFTSLMITGDSKYFHQAIVNILKNSIEAMPDGGTLSIVALPSGDHVVIKIADTGIGMSQKQLERLGQPYFTTKDQMGTGLGMMVTYSVIEGMRGHITVQSEQHKGTTFTIHFPYLDVERIEASATKEF